MTAVQEAKAPKAERAKKEFCTTLEVVAIVTALNEHCRRGEDSLVVYTNGMNDDRIVDEVVFPSLANGKPHSPERRRAILHKLQSVRRSVYGDIKKKSTPKGVNSKTMRADAMEARLTALEATVADLIAALGFKSR